MNRNKLDMEGLPSSYFSLASELLKENNGQHKIRMRNDQIHGDLVELAIRNKSQVRVHKADGKLSYAVEGMGIIVTLVA